MMCERKRESNGAENYYFIAIVCAVASNGVMKMIELNCETVYSRNEELVYIDWLLLRIIKHSLRMFANTQPTHSVPFAFFVTTT